MEKGRIVTLTAPTLAPDQRLDWWRILEDLRMHRMTLEAISEATGIPKSTLLGYKNLQAEPKHADGERLLAVWRTRMLPPVPIIRDSVRSRSRV